MNKVLFVVFGVIVACAMALPDDLEKKVCSIQGTGKADVTGIGNGISAKMTRVRDFVRYDIITGTVPIASLLLRGDTGYMYIYKAGDSCVDAYARVELYYFSSKGKSPEGYDMYQERYDENYFWMYFKDGKLVKEFLQLDSFKMNVTIKYDKVDYNFELNDEDDTFTIDHEDCSAASEPPERAKTLVQCSSLTLPEDLCSVSATGTVYVEEGYYSDFSGTVKMYRVKNTVRYDFMDGDDIYASYIIRPDLRASYYVKPSSSYCSFGSYPKSISEYTLYDLTSDGVEVYGEYEDKVYIDHKTHKLVGEYHRFYMSDSMKISINYTSVDYKYVHSKVDNLFSVDEDSCPEAKSNAPYATTSMQCDAPAVINTIPSGKCSYVIEEKFPENDASYGYSSYYLTDKYVVSLLMDGNKILVASLNAGPEDVVVRFDIKDDEGNPLTITNAYEISYDGAYAYEGCEMEYGTRYLRIFRDVFPLNGFEYRCEPETVKCPDKTSGCKKYCSCVDDGDEDDCLIFDKEDRLVAIPFDDDEYITLTYKDTVPSIGDFRGTFCNRTRAKAPNTKCTLSPESASLSLSTASFALPSVVFVVFALVLALF